MAVFSEVESAEIEAPAAETATEAFMDPSVLKGSKVKKTKSSIYGSTQWTLKNGVKVIVLPTEHKKDQILFNLYKAGGQSLISTEDLPSFDSNIYGTFDAMQGISKFKGTEVTKMLSGKNVRVGSYIDALYNGVSGSSSVKDLETAFQLLYLVYADPRFDQEEWDNAISQLKAVLPNALATPQFKMQKELNDFLYGGNPRREFISMETFDKANLATVEKNYRKLFSDVSGATMVITGDVDLETLKPLVEKYVGSLPKGKKASKTVNVTVENQAPKLNTKDVAVAINKIQLRMMSWPALSVMSSTRSMSILCARTRAAPMAPPHLPTPDLSLSRCT